MKIVLSILSFLGWFLLIILLVLFIVLFLLLFCRLHYVVEGEWLEEKWARFKAHWLFHLIRAKVSYGDDLLYGEVRVAWKKFSFSFDLSEKKEDVGDEIQEVTDGFVEEVSEEVSEEEAEDISDTVADEPVEEVRRVEEKVIGTETTAELRGEAKPWSESQYEDTVQTESDENVFAKEQRESIVSKIKGIIERIKQVYLKIKNILTDEQNQDAVKHLKDELVYLIKIFLPKKSKIDAVFSTGSPDTTGQLFGVLACFPAMYQKDWKLIPDFQSDDAYFKGTFWGRGWIALYQLVGIVLRILFDKNCRRLYTMIKKFLKWIKKDDKSQEEK